MKKSYVVFIMILIIACICPFVEQKPLDQKKVEKEIVKLTDEKWQKEDNRLIRRNFHINSKDYDYSIFYNKISPMEVEELVYIKEDNQEKHEEIVQAFQQRIDEQITAFQGYGEKQVEILKKAVIIQNGNDFVLIIHDDVKKIAKMIQDCH